MRLVWMIGILVLLAGAGWSTGLTGWLHTNGREVLDDANHPVRFCGVNVSGMEYGTGVPFAQRGPSTYGGWATPDPRMYDHLQAWGVNVVRLPIAWANLEPKAPVKGKHSYNQAYLQALDGIVTALGKRHIGVILSMHQWAWSPAFQAPRAGDGKLIRGCGMPVWLYPNAGKNGAIGAKDPVRVAAQLNFFLNIDHVDDGLIAAWCFLARRYADNTAVVGADLFNEPGIFQSDTVKSIPLEDFYQRIGDAVQAVQPHWLLAVQGGPHTPVDTAPRLRNLVCSFHMYPKTWDADTQALVDRHLARAVAWNTPLWVGEFRAIGDEATPAGPTGWKAQTAGFLAYLKARDIHWTYWAYQRALFALGDPKVNTALAQVLQAGM